MSIFPSPCGTRPIAAALLLITSSVASGVADDRPSILLKHLPAVERLSEEATSYVYRMGWPELQETLRGTTALKVIEDPQVQLFFDEFQRVSKGGGSGGDRFDLILTSLQQELVLAGTNRSSAFTKNEAEAAEALEAHEESGMSSVEIGIVTPAPAVRSAYARLAEAVIGARNADPPSTTGADAWTALGAEAAGPYFHWTGETAYWANSRLAANWVLDNEPEKPLAASTFFQATIKPLLTGQQHRPIALYYYDLRPNWERYDENPSAAGWNMMSWRSLDGVAGATFVEDGGFRNRHYWSVGDTRTGLFRHTVNARIDQEWLARVPADASGLTTGLFDPLSFVGSVGCLGAWMTGADDDTIAQLPSFLVMLKPLMGSVGNRYLVYRMPGRYGTFPFSSFMPNHNLITVVEIRSPDAFRSALENSLGMAGGFLQTLRTSEVSGYEVLEINFMYFTLYLAMLEDEALITLHPQLLKDALENWRHPGPAIIDTPAFREARKYLLKDACFLMYFPPGGFARGIYDEYIPMLQQSLGLARETLLARQGPQRIELQDPQRGFNPLVLPRGSDIARHVAKATILSAHDDGEGILFDGYAPVLSTPYYWTYVHALTRFTPEKGLVPVVQLVQWLVTPPAATRPDVPSSEPTTTPNVRTGE